MKFFLCLRLVREKRRRVEGRFLVKGNKDERIHKKCSHGEENVHCWKKKVNLWCNSPPEDGAHSSSPNVLVCAPPLVNFVADIVLCSFPFYLHWGNWQRKVFRLNNIRRATMTDTSFNKHINTSSLAFAHSKCVSKLSVVPNSWFLFSETRDEPLVWNSSKRQIERHLWYHFFTKRKTILFFLANRPLEPVWWLTEKLVIKGRKYRHL